MLIEFRCIQCHRQLRVSDSAVGKKARCPECGTIQDVAWSALSGGPADPQPAAGSAPPPQKPFVSNPFAESQASSAPPAGNAPAGPSQANPYQAPHAFFDPSASEEWARSKCRIPALALLIVAAFSAALQLLGIASLVFHIMNGGPVNPVIARGIGILFGLSLNVLIIAGARQMQRLEAYNLALTAAILACLPCGGCCSIPFGIWALIVLLDPQVRSQFR